MIDNYDLEKIDKKAILGFMQIQILQKFMNNPKRLGMTQEEQQKELDEITGVFDKMESKYD